MRHIRVKQLRKSFLNEIKGKAYTPDETSRGWRKYKKTYLNKGRN